ELPRRARRDEAHRAAGFVPIPDRHGERPAPAVGDADDRNVRPGEECLALGSAHAERQHDVTLPRERILTRACRRQARRLALTRAAAGGPAADVPRRRRGARRSPRRHPVRRGPRRRGVAGARGTRPAGRDALALGLPDAVERDDAEPLLGREAFGAQRLDRPIACAGIERIAPRDGVTRLAVIVETPLPGGPLAVEVLEAVGRLRAEGTLSQGPDLGGRGAARPPT